MESLKLTYADGQSDYVKQMLKLQAHGVSPRLGSVPIPKERAIDTNNQSSALEGGAIVFMPARQYSSTTALAETRLIDIFSANRCVRWI